MTGSGSPRGFRSPSTGRDPSARPARPSEMDREAFVSAFGGIFEHSPWIAEGAFELELGPTHDTAPGRAFRADPRLPHRLGGGTPRRAEGPSRPRREARGGQAADRGQHRRTGLRRARRADRCGTRGLHRLNAAYTAKFGFPFIIAVRDHDKAGILAAFRRRIEHPARPNSPRPAARSSASRNCGSWRNSDEPRDPHRAPDGRGLRPVRGGAGGHGRSGSIINQGLCGRFTTAPARFRGRPRRDQPLQIRGAEPALWLEMVERHPLGSQAFLPMSLGPVPRDRGPGRGRRAGQAAGVSHRAGAGDQPRPRHLARGSHAAGRPGPFRA
jgi:hypothetical protein